jgi:hypothetical protein
MKAAYASKLIGNQAAPVGADAQGSVQNLHPNFVICHACDSRDVGSLNRSRRSI